MKKAALSDWTLTAAKRLRLLVSTIMPISLHINPLPIAAAMREGNLAKVDEQ